MTAVQETNTGEIVGIRHECRACLQTIETVINLFKPWSPDKQGMENSLAEELAKISNIQISEADRHSKFICKPCCDRLQDACQFVYLVRENDRLLRLRYPPPSEDNENSCEKSWPKPIQIDKNIPYENALEVDIKQEVLSEEENDYNVEDGYRETEFINHLDIKVEPEEIVQTKPLPIVINGATSLHEVNAASEPLENGPKYFDVEFLDLKVKEELISDAEDAEIAPGDLSLECMLCTKIFNSVSGLKAHVISQHSYKTVKRKAGDSSPTKARHTCAACKRTFTTPTDLMVHETCHNKHACYGCNAKFDTFLQLTCHRHHCKALAQTQLKALKTLDDVIRPLPEEVAVKKIESNSDGAPESLVCDLCKEEFTDSYYMKIHQEVHHSKDSPNLKKEDTAPMKIEVVESPDLKEEDTTPIKIETLQSISNEDT